MILGTICFEGLGRVMEVPHTQTLLTLWEHQGGTGVCKGVLGVAALGQLPIIAWIVAFRAPGVPHRLLQPPTAPAPPAAWPLASQGRVLFPSRLGEGSFNGAHTKTPCGVSPRRDREGG